MLFDATLNQIRYGVGYFGSDLWEYNCKGKELNDGKVERISKLPMEVEAPVEEHRHNSLPPFVAHFSVCRCCSYSGLGGDSALISVLPDLASRRRTMPFNQMIGFVHVVGARF